MHKLHKSTNFLIILLACVLSFALATPALSGEEPIGKLTDFSGAVIIKSKGSWAAEPTLNHPLYSSDKVVTRVGRATITFNDGAVVKIANNSNLLIKEGLENEGVSGKTKAIKRRLRLILGKLSFKTGISKQKRDTIFETPTAVCAIRGTAGTLSVDATGQTYTSFIEFTEGGMAYKFGYFNPGIARVMSTAQSDKNPAQRAALVAKAAADMAVKSKGTKQGIKSDTCHALELKAAANEVKIQAMIMLKYNPGPPEFIKRLKKEIEMADKAIKAAQILEDEVLKEGGFQCGGPEAYRPPGSKRVFIWVAEIDDGPATPIGLSIQ